ncbi:DNA breaking-rejoining enzyme [Mycena haematopus]|nr:DNA breaking-rejoining enzyme [Mycena haematopus]
MLGSNKDSSCDSIKLDGSLRDPSEVRLSFANAQKMRAAASWNFAQMENQGNAPWHKSEVTGKWVGNPSVSTLVSQYMTSLKRRKVHAGEVATSARAITPSMLEKLYDFNHEEGRSTVKLPGSIQCKRWDGAPARLASWAAYLIAFNCLLRVDEVLKIQAHDIRRDPENEEGSLFNTAVLSHPDIEPFYLYPLPENQAHLCAVRAYTEWVDASHITEGFLFPKIGAGDKLMTDKDDSMSSPEFLEMFRNHLLDINVDPYPYGTHSFRRGGCQYFHVYRRWSIRDICQWGGWSTEFSSLTIVKYLISWNDTPVVRRRDFFNPNRVLQIKCAYCGRSCNCA